MRDFMKLLTKEDIERNNISYTENGAAGYKSTGKALLDINFLVSSLRSTPIPEVLRKFMLAYHEDRDLALKWIFFARDIRQGMGEKRLWKLVMRYLATEYTEDIRHLITPEIIGEYGCWKDILEFFGTPLEKDALECIAQQLRMDSKNESVGKPISLLAKWLPSINTTSADSRKLARVICSYLNLSEREYRKMLARRREYIKVIEAKMTANEWSAIDYSAVPSVANMKYAKAFMKHDEDRRREFLESLKKGEAKINSKDLYPYEITYRMNKFYNEAYYTYSREYFIEDKDLGEKGIFLRRSFEDCPEYKAYWEHHNMDMLIGMWKELPNLVPEDTNILVVRDGSGSMTTRIDANSHVTAFDVANSLTLYFAEKLSGAWKNKFITFSSKPKLTCIPETVKDTSGNEVTATVFDKFKAMLFHRDMSNTDVEAVFDLVLDVAVKNNLKQEELPGSILMVSDMEFDRGTTCTGDFKPLFEHIKRKFEDKGYKMPKLIFWNVCSRTGTIPLRENELGVTLVSGFSIQIMNMVMSNKTDPYEVLVDILMTDRYKPITVNKG